MCLRTKGGNAVVTEFDFKIDGDQLRGKGWRGLIALGFVLAARRGIIIAILALLVTLSGGLLQLSQVLQHLIGT
jgi:hypothetical protein